MKSEDKNLKLNESNLLKKENYLKTHKTIFDLLGYDENSLSKVFAYLLSNNRKFYFIFLKKIGLNVKNTEFNYKTVKIEIQKKRQEGITDIEITGNVEKDKEYHIIIECKINKNKVKEQRTKYLNIFKINKNSASILVFLTSDLETFKLKPEVKKNINIYKLTWVDIFSEIYSNQLKKDTLIIEVKKYIERGYNMNNYIKEILVQDLGDKTEIERFLKYNVYRRSESSGNPLYFAPYFTKRAKYDIEGIKFVSKILGVLTIPLDNKNKINLNFEIIKNDLKQFFKNLEFSKIEEEELLNKWKGSFKLKINEKHIKNINEQTFYFLDNPIILPGICKKKPIKDSKGWVGGLIPKNRTVTFKALIENMDVGIK